MEMSFKYLLIFNNDIMHIDPFEASFLISTLINMKISILAQ